MAQTNIFNLLESKKKHGVTQFTVMFLKDSKHTLPYKCNEKYIKVHKMFTKNPWAATQIGKLIFKKYEIEKNKTNRNQWSNC